MSYPIIYIYFYFAYKWDLGYIISYKHLSETPRCHSAWCSL